MQTLRIGVVHQGTEKVWQYVQPLRDAGATVEVLDWRDERDPVADAAAFDGHVLCGGDDLPGRYFGEPSHPAITLDDPARDRYELLLCRELLRRRAPWFAVCRGMQVMAVAAGGTLHQHVPDLGLAVEHRGGVRHAVRVLPDAPLLDGIAEPAIVNTYHHQSVRAVSAPLRVVALSEDGLVEAVAGPGTCALGVQWHPEREGNSHGLGVELFAAFVRALGAQVSVARRA